MKYPGSKWGSADWIISHFPEHHSYLEPFFGSGGVFFNKPRSDIETINDLDGEVVNLFRQIRNDPERLAREIYFTPYSREGKAFRLKEKAGFHVISIDENRPPLVQVVGDNVLIAQMLAFAISEIIENSVKNGVPREQAEGMFRIALELGIATSRN